MSTDCLKTAVLIGTGPSLTLKQIEVARSKGFDLYGCNNVYQMVPDLKLLYACNEAWWDEYWESVKDHVCEKWTTNPAAAARYGVNHIEEVSEFGLSETPGLIHHGHGSGFSLLSMAHEKGYQRVILLGYDMRYPVDYNGVQRRIGTGKRHYFGEYPKPLTALAECHG